MFDCDTYSESVKTLRKLTNEKSITIPLTVATFVIGQCLHGTLKLLALRFQANNVWMQVEALCVTPSDLNTT